MSPISVAVASVNSSRLTHASLEEIPRDKLFKSRSSLFNKFDRSMAAVRAFQAEMKGIRKSSRAEIHKLRLVNGANKRRIRQLEGQLKKAVHCQDQMTERIEKLQQEKAELQVNVAKLVSTKVQVETASNVSTSIVE